MRPSVSGSDSLDDRGPYEAVLGGAADRVAGYLVTESVPLAYDRRTWPDGERSPGVKQITMFDKRPDIDDAQVLRPVARLAHAADLRGPPRLPLRASCRGAAPSRTVRRAGGSIVEEGLREVEDLTDPMRYFSAGGSPDALEHNVKRVMDDVSTFLDLGSVESYPTAEYILRGRAV